MANPTMFFVIFLTDIALRAPIGSLDRGDRAEVDGSFELQMEMHRLASHLRLTLETLCRSINPERFGKLK